MLSKLNKIQIESISEFFADLAKILFGSAVVGFFVPGFAGNVSIPTFVVGSLLSAGLFISSVIILKEGE